MSKKNRIPVSCWHKSRWNCIPSIKKKAPTVRSNSPKTYHVNVYTTIYMGVSKNRGTPKSSILIGFSIVNHPFWGTPIFGNTHIYIQYIIPYITPKTAPFQKPLKTSTNREPTPVIYLHSMGTSRSQPVVVDIQFSTTPEV